MPIKRKNIKRRKTQKGGYKYNSSSILDSLSEEINSSSKSNKNNKKLIQKTRKRHRHKSKK
jgi:hypothetical protein